MKNPPTIENPIQLPRLIQLENLSPNSFIEYYLHHKTELESILHTWGAIKFAGVRINSTEDFKYITDSISTQFLNYIDGNSPRTKLSDHVYTSTEYDPSQRITMHNELSYSAKWPQKLFFTCITPAETGGETLLADSREILGRMHASILTEIEKRGVNYIRNLHGGQGMGPSWQDTFESADKKTVEAYCQSYGIDYEWGDQDSLKLKQFSKGTLQHHKTGDMVWFNQIDQFHPCHLGEEMYETLLLLYETPENFPTYVSFGDGTAISEDMIKEVLKTIDEVTIAPAWQKNELLILDNELVAHGRNSFTGNRKVLVAMSA